MAVYRCHGNSVPYQHLPGSVGEIQVDQVVPLGAPDSVAMVSSENPSNAVRHVTKGRKKVSVKGTERKVAMETRQRQQDRGNNGMHEGRRDRLTNKELMTIIDVLRDEVKELKLAQAQDRYVKFLRI